MEEIFRIVKIVDDETIVINGGYNDGIKEGDRFEIFEVGEKIIDPETGDDLGTLDIVKETVDSINVFQKLTICRHKTTVPLLPMPQTFSKETNKTLNVDTTQISGGLPDKKIIKIGDKVRKIIK